MPSSHSTTSTTTSSIPVVVVESHQHLLEHMHHLFRYHHRRCFTKNKKIKLIHFDSHPDMACLDSTVPALACFLPRNEWRVQRRGDGGKLEVCGDDGDDDDESDSDLEEEEECDTNSKEGDEIPKHHKVQKHNLYELLDLDTSGIAQWILPLFYISCITSLTWIKQSFCRQFMDGMYNFHVGAAYFKEEEDGGMEGVESFLDLNKKASLKVDLYHSYYIDDDSVVKTEELILPQEVRFNVETWPPTLSSLSSSLLESSVEQCALQQQNHSDVEGEEWILDICLDYFICTNPFYESLYSLHSDLAVLMKNMVEQTTFYKLSQKEWVYTDYCSSRNCGTCDMCEYKRDGIIFYNLMTKILKYSLQSIEKEEEEKGTKVPLTPIQSKHELKTKRKEKDYIVKNSDENQQQQQQQQGQEQLPFTTFQNDNYKCLTLEEYAQFVQLYSPTTTTTTTTGHLFISQLEQILTSFPFHKVKQKKEVIKAALEALPNLTLPSNTTTTSSTTTNNSNNTKESENNNNQQTTDVIKTQLSLIITSFQSYLTTTYRKKNNKPPIMITVARSTMDGYTSPTIVEYVQNQVLDGVHSIYCGCSNRHRFRQQQQQEKENDHDDDATKKDQMEEEEKKRDYPTIDSNGIFSKPDVGGGTDNGSSSSSFPCNNSCRFKIMFDYGEWEGSNLDDLL